jgi:catechol 2,3-dioxygenase
MVSLEIATQDMLQAQEQRLTQAGAPAVAITDGIETADPWGTKVRLIKT